MKKHSKVTSLF